MDYINKKSGVEGVSFALRYQKRYGKEGVNHSVRGIYLTMMDSMEALNASMDTVLALGVDVVVVVVVSVIEFELVAAPKTAATEEEEEDTVGALVEVDGVAVAAVIGTVTGAADAEVVVVVSLLR